MKRSGGPKTRVVIYGSCVSRDTFEFLDPSEFQLDRYIARQSLISAYSVPTPVDESALEQLTSDFQRRTVRDDFRGSLHHDLMALGSSADVVLWDITDERFGVWDLGQGRYVTRSVELIASGLDKRLEFEGRLIAYGTREHRALWGRAVNHFATSVRATGFRRAPVLLALPWADVDELGRRVATPGLPDNRKANKILNRYVTKAGKVTALALPARDVIANTQHRWGLAPYHYADENYEAIAPLLARALKAL